MRPYRELANDSGNQKQNQVEGAVKVLDSQLQDFERLRADGAFQQASSKTMKTKSVGSCLCWSAIATGASRCARKRPGASAHCSLPAGSVLDVCVRVSVFSRLDQRRRRRIRAVSDARPTAAPTPGAGTIVISATMNSEGFEVKSANGAAVRMVPSEPPRP